MNSQPHTFSHSINHKLKESIWTVEKLRVGGFEPPTTIVGDVHVADSRIYTTHQSCRFDHQRRTSPRFQTPHKKGWHSLVLFTLVWG